MGARAWGRWGSWVLLLISALAACSDPKPLYDAHLSTGGVCIGDLHGCPASFDLVPCTAKPGSVGLCNDDHLMYTYAEGAPGMPDEFPGWLCFYDATSRQLIGQRVCIDEMILCGGTHLCADTPGTPYCNDFITTVPAPLCPDAGAPDR